MKTQESFFLKTQECFSALDVHSEVSVNSSINIFWGSLQIAARQINKFLFFNILEKKSKLILEKQHNSGYV
jgi:hypothetical protein